MLIFQGVSASDIQFVGMISWIGMSCFFLCHILLESGWLSSFFVPNFAKSDEYIPICANSSDFGLSKWLGSAIRVYTDVLPSQSSAAVEKLSERDPKSKEFCCFAVFFSKIFISISKIGSNHWDAYIYIVIHIYAYVRSFLQFFWLDTEKRSVGLLSNWTHNPGRSRKERPMLGRSRFFGLFGALIWCKKTRARPRPVIFLRIYSVLMVGMYIWNPMHMIYFMIYMIMTHHEWSYSFVMCTCITREVEKALFVQ